MPNHKELEKIITELFEKRFGGEVLDNVQVGSNSNYTYGTFKQFCIDALTAILKSYVKKDEVAVDEEKIEQMLMDLEREGEIIVTNSFEDVAHALAEHFKECAK